MKGVAGLIAEPFCCWEVFPCLSPNPSSRAPGKAVCWKRVCVCGTDTDFSAVFFWKCNKSSLAGSPLLLGAVNLYSGHGKRHVLCRA